jgi:hypothetical protein
MDRMIEYTCGASYEVAEFVSEVSGLCTGMF